MWHDNGAVKKDMVFNDDGYIEGAYKEWYSNGQLRLEGLSKNGKKDGIWKEYDEKGDLVNEFIFDEGEEISIDSEEIE
jgi:antitoxin component YwqK of YwqJK toxin-antitoxin module